MTVDLTGIMSHLFGGAFLPKFLIAWIWTWIWTVHKMCSLMRENRFEKFQFCDLTNIETCLGGGGGAFRPICSKLRFCLLNTIVFRIITWPDSNGLLHLTGIQQKYLLVTSNYVARKLGVKKMSSVKEAKTSVPTASHQKRRRFNSL